MLAQPFCSLAFQDFPQNILFAIVVYIGFGFFDYVLVPLSDWAIGHRVLPDKARRNVILTFKDNAIVQFNRLVTVMFLYHLILLSCNDSLYSMDDFIFSAPSWAAAVRNTLAQLAIFAVFFPVVIVFYDLFYCLFHRVLHFEWLYPYIHKHHHLQYTPWRGNVDAINTHPIEYIIGEYDHLWSLYWVAKFTNKAFGYQPHAIFALLYIVIAGLLSTLNHTRVDVRIPYLYNVWWHDLHHRVPPTNYGQYTMLWDWIFGWYKDESTRTTVVDEIVEDNTSRKSVLAAAAVAATSTDEPVARKSSAAAVRKSSPASKKKATTNSRSRSNSASPKKSKK